MGGTEPQAHSSPQVLLPSSPLGCIAGAVKTQDRDDLLMNCLYILDTSLLPWSLGRR